MNQVIKTLFCTSIILLLFLPKSNAQHLHPHHRSCGTDEEMEHLIRQNPSIIKIRERIEEHTQRFIASQPLETNRMAEEIITIPVVVHIVYNTPAENISFAQIQSQIDVLNQDFRRLNRDTTGFWPQGDDAGIEFCLAAIDPDGLPTNGVTRTQTTRTSFQGDAIKFTATGGQDAWPRSQYMNMWVGNIGNRLLGFATLPGGPANTDGVVINYPYFGDAQFATPPFNLGRTTTHEVGHWLNLLHPWGNGGCNSDDGVGDTPSSSGPNYGCATGVVSCTTVDMVENYMDYSNDSCMNLFTQGQKLRMRAVFAPGGFREPILSSEVCCPEIPNCPIISSWNLNTLSDSSVQLQISSFTVGDSAIVRFAPLGTTNWDSIYIYSDTTLIITGLDPCSDYLFGIQTACDSESTIFDCNQQTIATVGCCESPTFNPNLVMGDSTFLNWNPIYGAVQYQIEVREPGANTWNTFVVSDTNFSLSSLRGCTTYELRTRSACQIRGNVIGPYSAIDTFSTPFNRNLEGCTQCQDTSYCAPEATSSTDAHINNVQFGPIFETFTGPSATGLDDFTGTLHNIKVDTTYIISLNAGNNADLAWKVWIDLDQDGSFNDSTELLLDEAFPTNNLLQPIVLAEDFPLGITRLRIGGRLLLSNNTWDACNMNGSGEYEDYCINLIPRCLSIDQVTAELDSTTEKVLLSWPGNPNATYEYGYQLEGDSTWTALEVDSNYVEISPDSLFGCSVYTFRVKLNCFGQTSTYTLSDSIKTICAVGINTLREQDIRVYPNPARDQLRVETSIPFDGISLVNVVGQEIIHSEGSSRSINIRLEEIPNGVYFLKIYAGKQEVWKRVMISK